MVYYRKQRGDDAESRACRYLIEQGMHLITRNYRCRWGEIDLIMRDHDYLVFVEVRYRSRQDFGGAAASVGKRKQEKLSRTALHYLSYVEKNANCLCRIDVVALDNEQHDICWLQNAIEATG